MMIVYICGHFGTFCTDAEKAAELRGSLIDAIAHDEEVVFDFEGVRNMNSSFCYALITPLVAQHADAFRKLKFRNFRPGLDIMLRSAIDVGLSDVDAQKRAYKVE